ncbi:CoA pyrophosphatase [Bdellovibrio bacteriovorus]|nr:CoA pyrophosphatase [Bdellovibrio bacteriovorus]AHZ86729.1 DNA mismatch repair protein MutT [Bdellovibrio bacteriovorus]BEV67169.1 putative Nudix hydrolase NudL [Bdellovibrio bacteriovorus]
MSSLKESLYSAINVTMPLDLSTQLGRHACVALILRGNSLENLELGYIQRAFSDSDRWSGQLAFPGGKREDSDKTDLDAALRETLEEVGIDLTNPELLGRLNDIQARKAGTMLDFYIRPFVFFTERNFNIVLDKTEVADFFWVPLKEIQNPQRVTTYRLQRENIGLELPAVYLDREPPLWGLSYMMTLNLLEVLAAANK